MAGRNDPVDWRLAARIGASLVPAGDTPNPEDAAALVADLRAGAARAIGHVAAITHLEDAAARALEGDVLVLDRAGLVRADAAMLEATTAGAWPLPEKAGVDRLSGVEIGAALAAFATRALGQFDPFTTSAGRLYLVAPNVWRFEGQLDADPADFRLWVCLHEQTHAVQFAAAPWLAEHLSTRMKTMIGMLPHDASALESAADVVRSLPRVLSERDDDEGTPAILQGSLSEEERDELGQIMAVMSLLEGHADVVMDAVGPKVVASIEQIRHRFDARRFSGGRLERTLRRLMGLDAKMAQYRDGARFVRGVLVEVGHEGLAAVWSGPDALPTSREIADPRAWVRRVHG